MNLDDTKTGLPGRVIRNGPGVNNQLGVGNQGKDVLQIGLE